MLSNKKIIKILNNGFYNSEKVKNKNDTNKNKKINKYFVPIFHDSLFWCFYIFYKGHNSYENCSKSGFKEEKEFKFKFIENLKKDTTFCKQHKIKYLEIENECVNMKKIGFSTLRALSLYYKINIFLIKNKLYYRFGDCFNNSIFLIHLENEKYGINEKNSQDRIDYIEKNYIELQPNKKPLKGMSAYSANELKIMNQKLELSIYNEKQKVKVKKELYEQLVQYIV